MLTVQKASFTTFFLVSSYFFFTMASIVSSNMKVVFLSDASQSILPVNGGKRGRKGAS